jgi:hypothetical protein
MAIEGGVLKLNQSNHLDYQDYLRTGQTLPRPGSSIEVNLFIVDDRNTGDFPSVFARPILDKLLGFQGPGPGSHPHGIEQLFQASTTLHRLETPKKFWFLQPPPKPGSLSAPVPDSSCLSR